tara:strand:- start:921 stop:1835 length:915 start_codon:yes stop_codon:yes gene_type:complete
MTEKVTQTEQTNDFMDDVANAVMDDSSGFFEELEQSVNGTIADPGTGDPQEKQVTQDLEAPKEVAENQDSNKDKDVVDWEDEGNPYKKRYADSTRENSKNQQVLRENEKYNAILNVMKKDPGLVDNVRQYLEKGPSQSPKEQLGLDEDFIFDPDEAFTDPNSKSAQVFSNVVNRIVDRKVQATENKVATAMQEDTAARQKRAEARTWMKKNNMTEKEFAKMMDQAQKHQISYDDMNLILNKDKFAKNVAANEKKQVAEQIKNVQASSTPSIAAQGSADNTNISTEDKIFNSLLGLDNNDNLFEG